MPSQPSKNLDVFPNPHPQRDYVIHFEIPEFTCLCPLTGQPDFAIFNIQTIPNQKCIELKSLKMYMWSYRNEGAFHEDISNRILNDLVTACEPRFMRLTARWYVRGGIFTNVMVEHRAEGWQPQPTVHLPEFPSQSNIR